MLLPTFCNKYAVSWPPDGERKPSRAHYLPADDLFVQQHQSDVHFAAYNSNKLCRLKSEAVGKADWAMVAFVVDVDAPKDAPQTEIDAWFELEKPKIARVVESTNVAVAYRSKSGGYRLIWWLEKPYRILSPEGLRAWRSTYIRALLSLYCRFGIVADPSCGDATRIYRAPKVWLAESHKFTTGEHLCTMNETKALPKGFFSPNDQEIEAGKELANLSESWRKALAWLFPQVKPASMPRPSPSSNESAPILLRAEKYLEGMPPSISGAGGQKALWNAAFALTKGFGLSVQDAILLLDRSFNPRCRPPWSNNDLARAAQNSFLSKVNEGFLLKN